MAKKFNYKPLIEYTDYAERKYIKPEKAGDLKEDMELFRKKGQAARKVFTEIAKSLEEKMDGFYLQKVSSWMNQAQIARPYLWVFLKQEGDIESESGIALRVFKNEKTKKVGISLEVSFVERKIGENTLTNQNKVLEVPIEEPLYYFVQFSKSKENCMLDRIEGNEKNRKKLLEDMKEGNIRKVLVKFNVEEIKKFENLEDLTKEFLKGVRLLMPFYLKTKKI
mgnify:FL=1